MQNTITTYSVMTEKNIFSKKRIINSVLIVFAFLGLYAIWLCGTSKMEFNLEIPRHNIILQVFYSDGRPMNEAYSKSKQLFCGKSEPSFTFASRKVKLIRIDPGNMCGVKLKISKIRFSKGFTSREISLIDNHSNSIFKQAAFGFHQIKYLGNGYFLTTGNDPHFYLKLKKIPQEKKYPIYPAVAIITIVLLFFFFPKWTFILKTLHNQPLPPISARIQRQAKRLLHDYPFWIYALIVILLGWGFEIFNFTLTHDDEIIFSLSKLRISHGWVFQERWGMAIIALLTGNPTVPVMPLVVTLFCYFLSFCILFYDSRSADKYFIFPIYAAFPMLFQSFSFSSLNPGIGIAFLLSALSVYLINKRSKIHFLFAVLFTLFAFGTYAIFIIYIALAGLYSWIYRSIKHDFYCRFKYIRYIACKYISLAICCFLLHKIILYACNHILDLRTEDFISNNYILTIQNFSLWVDLVLEEILQFCSGSIQIFPKEISFHFLAIVFCFVLTGVFLFYKKINFFHKCILFFGCLFLLLLPFSPNIFHQYAGVPFRVITLLFPLGLVSIFHIVLVLSKPYQYVRAIVIGLLFFISIQYLWILNQNIYLNYMQNKRDIAVIYKLQNHISSIPEFALKSAYEKKIPVWIIGSNPSNQLMYRPKNKHYPDWQSESIGISCFSEPRRILAMLNMLCYKHYIISSVSTDKIPFIESMPMWPLNGSIAFHNDCLIIKLSDHLPSDSGILNRKLRYRNSSPVNGAEELTATRTDKMRLLHTYQASALRDPKIKAKGKYALINVSGNDNGISFPACKYEAPYVILEITADFDNADTLTLWCDQDKQFMQFSFNAGINHLKIRCPSYFLNKEFLIGFGEGKVRQVLLEKIKVFDDSEYTANLIALNPELDKKKLQKMLHE